LEEYHVGRIIEVYGPESSGKTTLTLHIVAEVQKMGGEAAFIDAEHALDPIYAKKLGVDIERLIVSQPDNGEEALEITEKLIRSSAVDLVVVDSVAALVPKAEIEGNMGDSHMALQARLMSQALRKIAGQMNKTNTTVIFINQIREKVGVMYGSPEVTPGGRALKFYSSVRIDIRKADKILENGVMVGNKTKVKIVKNKVAAPFKEVMLTMRYGKGLDTEGDIINLAIDFGVVEKAGSWFSYNGERIGQGREKVREYMEANPDKKEEIEEKVKQKAKESTSYGMMADDEDDSDVDTNTAEE
jgi:RecA protein